MVRVEIALARVEADLGLIRRASGRAMDLGLRGVEVSADLLAESVRSAGVPVPGLADALRAKLSPEDADCLHHGATSLDIVDTALCLCFGTALDEIAGELGALIGVLEALSLAHAGMLMLARTRGQLATPNTFGLRLAQWAQPLIELEGELPGL